MNKTTTLAANHSPAKLPADRALWARVNRELAAKILSEFMYEEMIHPTLENDRSGPVDGDSRSHFSLSIADGLEYRFAAKPRACFGFYRVLPDSIERVDTRAHDPADEQTDWQYLAVKTMADLSAGQDDAGARVGIEVETLLIDLSLIVSFKADTFAPAFRELSNTLFADYRMLSDPRRLSAADWLSADDARIEGELSAHPWIVANKSRLGFSTADYERYAPESARSFQLRWLGLARERGEFSGVPDLDYDAFLERLLTTDERAILEDRVREHGRDPENYYLMPAHPWQFENRIAYLFARDFAAGRLLDLGAGSDEYLPQQSIRTLTNITHPERPFVKLPISILNTSVYRGLPVERAKYAPALTHWLQSVARADDFLQKETRVVLLGEFATLQCRHSLYSKLPGVPYQYNEMFGAIFRESADEYLNREAGERALPLAALFQRDPKGDSVLAALIHASELDAGQWIDAFLKAVLEPLLHFLYKYGFVFSPHGQNALIALQNNRPTRLVIKDFVDDANLSIDSLPEHESLPEELYDLLDALEPLALIQWIQSGLFVCVFRYLTEILADDQLMNESDFWQRVVRVIRAYQKRFPEMQERFDHFNLFAPAFPKLTLNATRLLDIGYADSAERPTASVASLLDNPLYQIEEEQI
ncbi:MAG: IucA/IucC family siderophore biosynthesis protein [bacterium]|nr:IucA/IucC family siderophore biosynthesis protein [bacterium]